MSSSSDTLRSSSPDNLGLRIRYGLTKLCTTDPSAYKQAAGFVFKLHPQSPMYPGAKSSAKPIPGDGTAQRWLFKNLERATFKFGGTLDLQGKASRVGPYLNAVDADVQQAMDEEKIKRLRAIVEVRPLTTDDIYAQYYPVDAVQISQQAIGALVHLSANLEKKKPFQGPNKPKVHFLRAYDPPEDRYSFVLTTLPLAPRLSEALAAEVTIADLQNTSMSFTPSKLAKKNRSGESNVTATMSTSASHDSDEPPVVKLSEMPDPDHHYAALDFADAVTIEAPYIFDECGQIIHPKDYESQLEDGAVVVVEASMCMWDIKGQRRVCHLRLENMWLMPKLPPPVDAADESKGDVFMDEEEAPTEATGEDTNSGGDE